MRVGHEYTIRRSHRGSAYCKYPLRVAKSPGTGDDEGAHCASRVKSKIVIRAMYGSWARVHDLLISEKQRILQVPSESR